MVVGETHHFRKPPCRDETCSWFVWFIYAWLCIPVPRWRNNSMLCILTRRVTPFSRHLHKPSARLITVALTRLSGAWMEKIFEIPKKDKDARCFPTPPVCFRKTRQNLMKKLFFLLSLQQAPVLSTSDKRDIYNHSALLGSQGCKG